jgi:hypothetical protein
MTIKGDAAFIRLHHIGQTLEKDRLTRAAAAQHRNKATTRHVETRAIKHDIVTEALSQAFDLEQQWWEVGRHAQTRKEVIT